MGQDRVDQTLKETDNPAVPKELVSWNWRLKKRMLINLEVKT